MSKPKMKTVEAALIDRSLQYHLAEREKAAAARKAARFSSSDYHGAEFNHTWHSGAASALALVLGIEGDLDAITGKGGKPE